MKDIARPLLVFITFGFSILFLLYDTERVWGYPFSTKTHNAEAWIYFLGESLVRLAFVYIIWTLEPVFIKSMTAALWLMIADTVDYVLTCNEKWVKSWPDWATLNIFSIAIFGGVFVFELIKYLRHGRS